MSSNESFPAEKKGPLQEILKDYGNVKLRNPHYGLPDHENDPEVITVFEAQESCPPLIDALIRASSPELQRQIIDTYKVE